MGHVADLRGGRERSPGRPSRTATSSRSTPTTRTPTATPSRSRRSAATRTRRSSSTRAPGTIYLTEDAGNPNGLLYRWTPPDAALPLGHGSLRKLADDAGELDALKASTLDGSSCPTSRSRPSRARRYRRRVGRRCPTATRRRRSTRKQFADGQVTRSRKLEGMWWGDGGAYFVCSFARTSRRQRGPARRAGVVPRPAAETIELKLHFAYTPTDQDNDPDGPDNITVSAYGGVIIAEDGEGKQHLVGADRARRDVLLRAQRRTRTTRSSPGRRSRTTRRRCSRTSSRRATCSRSAGRSRRQPLTPAPGRSAARVLLLRPLPQRAVQRAAVDPGVPRAPRATPGRRPPRTRTCTRSAPGRRARAARGRRGSGRGRGPRRAAAPTP